MLVILKFNKIQLILNKNHNKLKGFKFINQFMDDTYDVYINNFSGENNTIGAIELSISNENIHKKLRHLNDIMDKSFRWHAF